MANSTSFHKGEIVSIVLTILVAILLAVHVSRGHDEDVVLAKKILELNTKVAALQKKVDQTAK